MTTIQPTRFPTVLYEDGGFPACGVLLDPDTDDAELDIIVADIPSYLDEWEDDRSDPDRTPTPTTWFVRRGLWAWEDDPDQVGRRILVPAAPGDEDAFRAVLLNLYSPWSEVCAHHPGLVATTGVPNPTTPDGRPYTYLCQDCAGRHEAARDAMRDTFIRLVNAGLSHSVAGRLLNVVRPERRVPDENTAMTVADLAALPVGALVSCEGRTWERVPSGDATPPGGMWACEGSCTSGEQLTQGRHPVHPLVSEAGAS